MNFKVIFFKFLQRCEKESDEKTPGNIRVKNPQKFWNQGKPWCLYLTLWLTVSSSCFSRRTSYSQTRSELLHRNQLICSFANKNVQKLKWAIIKENASNLDLNPYDHYGHYHYINMVKSGIGSNSWSNLDSDPSWSFLTSLLIRAFYLSIKKIGL